MFGSGIRAGSRSSNRSPMQFEPERHHLHQHHELSHQLHLHDDRNNGDSLSTHAPRMSHNSHSTHGLPGLNVPGVDGVMGNSPVFNAGLDGYSSNYSTNGRSETATMTHEIHQHRQPQTLQRKQLPQQRQAQEVRGHSRTPVSSSTAGLFESLSSAAVTPDSPVQPTLYHGQPTTLSGEESSAINTWRQRLFDLKDIVLLTNEEYQTYFPWIDNIYSHRSTQRYKSKPFVAHYYDCRLKGRPSGTKKSDDPTKKKRKRNARGLDLCDVKIKITKYEAGAGAELQSANMNNPELEQALARVRAQDQVFWTFQRINGSVTNGIGDGKPATHKHDLARSDEIKKSTRHRELAELERERKRSKRDKDMKRPPKPPPLPWKASGPAADTEKRHLKGGAIKFYASCFCPFSQRVWIALEAKGIDYQYCEIYPLQKPKPTQLLEANPRGLVPAIQQEGWACAESTVILEYLEEDRPTLPLLPTIPRLKANCRLWIEFINSRIVPSFYLVLSATEEEAKRRAAEKLQRDIAELVQAAEDGPYFLGDHFSLVDIQLAPFAIRLPYLLRQVPGWVPPPPESRWRKWLDALEQNEFVKNTTSKPELYEQSMGDLVKAFQARFQGDI
ncbi:putative glutathione S-transferase [Triangularia verruculosa]|uniref:Glutathione S-transferase n=1 Tax=Triangularia verruculosa TaxID=2587418 RepID=A0AAN7AS87_9PEZI|nr:putative glutathione S-transferase [Triangularia verruculosa]